jgi:hypothetical protein
MNGAGAIEHCIDQEGVPYLHFHWQHRPKRRGPNKKPSLPLDILWQASSLK